MEPGERFWRIVAPILIALAGASARQMHDSRTTGSFSWIDFFRQLVIAASSGLLAALFCSQYQMTPEWTGLISGMAGFFGVEFIEGVRRVVRGRFGL